MMTSSFLLLGAKTKIHANDTIKKDKGQGLFSKTLKYFFQKR